MDGLNRMRRVIFLALDPAGAIIDRLEAPEWLMRLFGISLSSAILGGAVWAIEGTRAGLFASAAFTVLILLILMTIAATRLQGRNDQLEAPPERPHNWEALIRTANRWHNAASDVASDHYVIQSLRKEDSQRVRRPDTKKQEAYDDATREFETEMDIAGGTLARMLLLAFAEARHAITACRYDHSTHDEIKCQEHQEKVYEVAREFTKALSD